MDILTGYNTGYTGNKHIPRGDKVRPINIKQAHTQGGQGQAYINIKQAHTQGGQGQAYQY